MCARGAFVIGLVGIVLVMACGVVGSCDAAGLFPTDVPDAEWATFEASGFSVPACGVVYRLRNDVCTGMPLGGIDTGCIDLDTNGLLGLCTIFNTHTPRRGPINLPILGLAVGGKTWVLCSPTPKGNPPDWDIFAKGPDGKRISEAFAGLKLDGVNTAKEIHYWGHYPVADLEFETDCPIQAGLRAWTPFLPGDIEGSMTPGAVLEVHLRNTGSSRQQGTIAFSFPGPTPQEAGGYVLKAKTGPSDAQPGVQGPQGPQGPQASTAPSIASGTVSSITEFTRREVRGRLSGVAVFGELASYAIGAVGERGARVGGELGPDGSRWARIAEALPSASSVEPGSSVAVDFSLDAGKEKIVRFVLAWSAPTWNGGGFNGASGSWTNGSYTWSNLGHIFTHMYSKYYPDAASTADLLARNHKSLLNRVLAWQQVVYTENSLPVWLRDSLVNILYLITEDGLWARKTSVLPGWVREEDGLFAMNESPRVCAQMECIPCSFYGNYPLVFFFPELALSTMRGYEGYSARDGMAVWSFGRPVELANPTPGEYQVASNGISLASMAYRFIQCHDTPDKKFLREFYPLVKKNMTFTVMKIRPDYPLGDRIISVARNDELGKSWGGEWFEAPEPGWSGMTAHIGGLHLAQLRIVQQMARDAGDIDYANQCEEWIRAGADSMENKLWDARGYYLNFWAPDIGVKSDLVFGYQLDGEWIIAHHGLEPVLPRDRVRTVLGTVKRCNIALSKFAATNYANPNGTPPDIKGYGPYGWWAPEALMLAMTYMYDGQREFGTNLAWNAWHHIVCTSGWAWEHPTMFRGDIDTGERSWGADYYQNMMLWAVPAAIEGKDLSSLTRPAGLVYRILAASRR